MYRNYDALADGELLVLASLDRTKAWWLEKLTSPPPYACGFINAQGDIEFIEPTEPCGKLYIAWRKKSQI